MSSDARAILTAVQTALQGISGLTVLIGEPASGFALPSPPLCYLSPDEIASAHDHALGDYSRAMSIALVGMCAATDLDGGEKVLAATDLLDSICAALEADPTLGGRVITLIVSGRAFVGVQSGGAEVGGVEAQIDVAWYAPRGQGV